eukprot:3205428-Heterocapsa_arctica.AAC.1
MLREDPGAGVVQGSCGGRVPSGAGQNGLPAIRCPPVHQSRRSGGGRRGSHQMYGCGMRKGNGPSPGLPGPVSQEGQ